jgi:hypothetical protein
MEWVSIFTRAAHTIAVEDGEIDIDWHEVNTIKTSNPTCTVSWLRQAVITTNDNLDGAERQRLIALIPRLMHAHEPNDEKAYYDLILPKLRQIAPPHRMRPTSRLSEETAFVASTIMRHALNDCDHSVFAAEKIMQKSLNDRNHIDQIIGVLNDLLDMHDKVMAEIGEAIPDPEDGYIDDETLAEILGAS